MTLFQNLRLTTKLRATFAFMVLASTAMSVLGYLGASTLMQFNSNLYSHELTGVSAIKEAAIFQAKSTRILGDVLLAFGDKDDIDEYKKTLDEFQSSVLENLNAAEVAFEDEGSKAEVRKVKAELPQFQAAATAVVQAAIDGDISAEKSARVRANVMANKMNLSIAQACRRREEAAKETRTEDAKLYTRLRVSLLSLAICIAFVGLCSGVSITHLVTKQLGAMTEVLAAAAEGDLTQRMQGERGDELGKMGSALNQALESTRAALMEVHRTTLALTTASEELNSSANELDRGSKDQSAGIARTSAALVKLTSGASKTAEDMRSASLLASGEDHGLGAQEHAETRASGEPASAVAAMVEINDASTKIADIISVVDTIAFQTSLLALNAAVEAAHAGDEGRGFAVVASEVRNLAKRSAESANEIKDLIQDSMAKVDRGAQLVGKVTELIGGIATASAEQSAGVQQVSAAMSRMDQVTRNNSVQAAKLSQTAHSLTEHASQLQEMVSRFQLGGAEEAFA